jgi:outer membrane lipase/esterase
LRKENGKMVLRLVAAKSLMILGIVAFGAAFHEPASADQRWTITIPPAPFVENGVAGTTPAITFDVSVASTTAGLGTFSLPTTNITVSCPSGVRSATFRVIDGRMSATSMTFTVEQQNLVCGQSGSLVTLKGSATLNAPFPFATAASGGKLTATGVPDQSFASSCADCRAVTIPPGCTSAQCIQATAGAKQAAALGTVAVISSSVQTTNIGLRLASLRRGATGASVSGVSFNVDGQAVPVGALTAALASLGGGASADPSGGKLGVFVNGQGSFGNQDPTARDAGFDFYTAGMTAGLDYRLTTDLVLGAAFGYLRTKTNFDASAGDSRINGYSLSLYGNYYLLEKLYVDGIATFGRNEYSNERNIANTLTARSSTDGNQFAISVSTGYEFNAAALTLGPTARVNYVRVHIDGYRETGADAFNLAIGSQTIESLTSALGGELRYAMSTGWGVLTPQLNFEWEHEYKGDGRLVRAGVLADPATAVAVRTASPDRDYANLGAGLSATFAGGVSAFVHYQALLGRTNFTNHAFNAGVRFAF